MRLIAIGLVAGFFSALFGVGGGIIAVPLLILLAAFPAHAAAATSLGAIAVTALTGTILYTIQGGHVNAGYALLVGLPAAVAAVFGAALDCCATTIPEIPTMAPSSASRMAPTRAADRTMDAWCIGVSDEGGRAG